MRALTVGLFLLIASSVAFAGDWQEYAGVAMGAYEVLKGSKARPAEPGQPATVSYQLPQRRADGRQFPLEWDREQGVIDASGDGGYYNLWSHHGLSDATVESSVEVVGAQIGLPFSPDDRQVQQTQDRSAKPGYDPRYSVPQGRQVAPQGIIQVTVTWSGYARSLLAEGRAGWFDKAEARYFQEDYKVALEATVVSLKTGLTIATARAEGVDSAKFREVEASKDGRSINLEDSRRARPDEACRRAAMSLMAQLSSQLLGGGCEQQTGVVVAGINGLQLYLTTVDNSEIRDAGLVEGFRYAVRGGSIINPVTRQPVSGQPVLCTVEVVDIDGAMATVRISVESTDAAARLPQIIREGDRVTLVPYQSLHQKEELER